MFKTHLPPEVHMPKLHRTIPLGGVVLSLALVGCDAPSPQGVESADLVAPPMTSQSQAAESAAIVTRVPLVTFQVPERVPNESVENPEVVVGSSAVLRRAATSLTATISTQDLPHGVYTFWWHLTHADGEVSILWAGNDVVSNANGNGQLLTRLPEGEENAPGFIFIGHGLQPGAAKTVEAQLWVRVHGPPSDDPDALNEQLTRPFGLCTDVRNPNPRPGLDFPCWNPQRALFGQP